MSQSKKTLALWVFLLLVFWAVYQVISQDNQPKELLTHTELMSALEEGRVERLELAMSGSGPAASFVGGLQDGTRFRGTCVYTDHLEQVANEQGVQLTIRPGKTEPGFWQSVMNTWLPMLFLVGVFLFVTKTLKVKFKSAPDLATLQTAPIQRWDQSTQPSLAEVIGQAEAKSILGACIQELRRGGAGRKRVPGLLLQGPPGGGKTWLAKAIAGDTKLATLAFSGVDAVNVFVGVGAARIRDLFAQAKTLQPSIVVIDRLDALARTRTRSDDSERERAQAQLYASMDDLAESGARVLVIGLCDRPDLLDAGILSPARVDRIVALTLPGPDDRVELVVRHAATAGLTLEQGTTEAARNGANTTPAELLAALGRAVANGRVTPTDLIAALGQIRNERPTPLAGPSDSAKS